MYEEREERKKMFSIYNVVKEEFIREMQAGEGSVACSKKRGTAI